tara:strand:+ start:66 stop:626 length:561 start_codon:yes stop_codon:yes gene_type:complete
MSVVIQIGKHFYKVPESLYKKYSSQLTKATKDAIKGAGSIAKISSTKLIKLLGGQKPTKASLSQKGVKKVATKGGAAVFGAGVVTGALLPKGKKTSYTPPGGTLAPFPRKKSKSKLKGVRPGRKPKYTPLKGVKPGRKPPPPLPKSKEVKPHSRPPESMEHPMTMKSGTKKYAQGGSVRKTRLSDY